jgi:hypothetical protein
VKHVYEEIYLGKRGGTEEELLEKTHLRQLQLTEK